jgi:hypothetical protein
VEGSQFQDLGNHELLSLGLLGGTMMSLWKPKSQETCMNLTLHKKPINQAMSTSDKTISEEKKALP